MLPSNVGINKCNIQSYIKKFKAVCFLSTILVATVAFTANQKKLKTLRFSSTVWDESQGFQSYLKKT